MATQAKPFLSPEEYLALEVQAERKSEYVDGQMVAMAGASFMHSRIVPNLSAALVPQLRGRDCGVNSNDLRVYVAQRSFYTYPDIVVVCGPPVLVGPSPESVTNPTLIVEVLSPSTEAYDRGRKFELYRGLDSFREYVLVAQDRAYVEHYVKQSDGRWLWEAAEGLEGVLALPSIGCTLTLREVYERTDVLE